jgi:beta propeller repeat protein
MKSLYIFIGLVFFSLSLSSSLSSGDSTTEFRITTSSRNQHLPAIYGNIVVWEDWRNGNADIYGYDLSTGEEFQITSEPYDQKNPAIHGKRVVWVQREKIEGYDLLTKTFFSIPVDTEEPENPAIYGDVVVWENIHDNLGIHGYNLQTQKDIFLSGEVNEYEFLDDPEEQQNPALFEPVVVWTDKKHQGDIIYAYDIEKGKEFRVNTSRTYFLFDLNQHYPVIHGDMVIWTEWDGDALYGYDLSTNNRFFIAYSRVSDCEREPSRERYGSLSPAIFDNIVLWVDCRNGNEDIFGYDLSTEKEFQITSNKNSQKSPAIYKNMVVWEDNRHNHWDIYGTDISTLFSSGKSVSRASLFIKEYALKTAIVAGIFLSLFLLCGEMYYIIRFHLFKTKQSFDQSKFYQWQKNLTPQQSLLYVVFYSFFGILYSFGLPLNERYLVFFMLYMGMIVFMVLVTIWNMMNPFVYVDDDRITIFCPFPRRWKTYARQSIEKSTFHDDIFEFHLVNGKKVTINPLDAHYDDQIVLLDALKKFFSI